MMTIIAIAILVAHIAGHNATEISESKPHQRRYNTVRPATQN